MRLNTTFTESSINKFQKIIYPAFWNNKQELICAGNNTAQ